jgi:hypothetical protein
MKVVTKACWQSFKQSYTERARGEKINKRRCEKTSKWLRENMSFRLGLNTVQEVLVLALMLVFVFAVFYSNIEFTYKIGIAVLVFSIIFLTSLAGQVLKQEEEKRRLQRA